MSRPTEGLGGGGARRRRLHEAGIGQAVVREDAHSSDELGRRVGLGRGGSRRPGGVGDERRWTTVDDRAGERGRWEVRGRSLPCSSSGWGATSKR